MGKIRPFIVFVSFFFSGLSLSNGQVLINYDPGIVIAEEINLFSAPESARVVLDVDEFPLADFSFAIPAGSSVFIGEVMWFFALSDTGFTIPVKELKKQFPPREDHWELAVFKKGIQQGEISIKKGFFPAENVSSPVYAPELTNSREEPLMERFFFLAVLVVFFLISLFKLIYPLVLSFFVRPTLVFSTEDFSESSSLSKLFSEEILFFLIIFNMLLMLLIMISFHYLEAAGGYWLGEDMNDLFFVWLLGTGVLLLAALVKFLWVKLCTWVFGIYRFEFIHFFYMLRIVSVVQIGIFSILIISLTNDIFALPALLEFLLIGLFAIYILGIWILFFILAKRVSSKKYHIFSYLCTAELVPFLVLSKLIIG